MPYEYESAEIADGAELGVYEVATGDDGEGAEWSTVHARVHIYDCDDPDGLMEFILPHIRAWFGEEGSNDE